LEIGRTVVDGADNGSTVSDEEGVERDRFREGHSDQALHEDLARCPWIATYGLGGLEADESDADCGAKAT
jgi:hypothetical protein